jgi:hypothetical protein
VPIKKNAEHGVIGDAAWEMGSGPAEQKIKTRTIFRKSSLTGVKNLISFKYESF